MRRLWLCFPLLSPPFNESLLHSPLLRSAVAGLSSEDAVDVITNGAMKCPMFDLKGPAMCEANYQTAFPLKHQQKDLRLALALGDDGDQGLSTVSAANERYKEAKALGLGDADFSAVLEASRRRQS